MTAVAETTQTSPPGGPFVNGILTAKGRCGAEKSRQRTNLVESTRIQPPPAPEGFVLPLSGIRVVRAAVSAAHFRPRFDTYIYKDRSRRHFGPFDATGPRPGRARLDAPGDLRPPTRTDAPETIRAKRAFRVRPHRRLAPRRPSPHDQAQANRPSLRRTSENAVTSKKHLDHRTKHQYHRRTGEVAEWSKALPC
jgi:hypothetical protein